MRTRRNTYKRFIKNNKVAWRNFNCAFFLGSLIMAGGSYEVIISNIKDREDCAGLRVILWSALILHTINTFVTLINLCGLETKCCFYNAVCTLAVVEMIAIVWLQVVYFNA